MTYTLTDYIRGFHKLNRAKCFSSSVQSTFLAIVCEFDVLGFPDEIELSTRELQLRSGLKSVATVHEAKNVLKMNRLIDFRTRKKQQTTFFTLCTGHLSECSAGRSTERSTEHSTEQGSEHSTEHLTEQRGLVCYTPAQVQSGDGGAPLPLPPTPPNPNPKKQPEIKAQPAVAEQAEQRDIVDVWEEMTRTKLTSPADQFQLRHYDDTHGREIVKVAIKEHVYGNGRTFKYFKACLDSLLAGLKGGEEVGESAHKARADNVNRGSRGKLAEGVRRGDTRQRESRNVASNAGTFGNTGSVGRFDNSEPDNSRLLNDIENLKHNKNDG